MLTLLQKLRGFVRHKQAGDPDERLLAQNAAAILAAVLVLGAIFWWVPRYQVRHTPGVTAEKRFDDEDAARKTLAQILGGTIVLLGLYFSAKTFGLSRESQITDRFTKAIEQLGKRNDKEPNIEVRLGAIYALERIAIDSPRDHWTIMEILTAYVRQNAPLDPNRPYTKGERPRTDIQAVLTVLGRRRTGHKRERLGQRLDLTHTRLCGTDFDKANLQSAKLNRSNMQAALLSEANLKFAVLYEVNLREAKYLRPAQVMASRYWQSAYYSPAFRAELGLPPEDHSSISTS